jgi:hypothetical protein
MKKQSKFSIWWQHFFCSHKYKITKEHDDKEERNKLVNELKAGKSISFSRLHRCEKCDKEIMISSGKYC